MSKLQNRMERIEVEEKVYIPARSGDGIVEAITVKVPALRDPRNGEVYLTREATAMLDEAKARHTWWITGVALLGEAGSAYGPHTSATTPMWVH